MTSLGISAGLAVGTGRGAEGREPGIGRGPAPVAFFERGAERRFGPVAPLIRSFVSRPDRWLKPIERTHP